MGIVSTIPEAGPGREEMLLGAVIEDHVTPISWHPVQLSHGPYQATIYVSGDTLRIGDAEGSVRINASHGLAQQIADRMGAVLPTAKISDQIWAQADIQIAPLPRSAWQKDGTMGRTHRMIEQSLAVDRMIADAGGSGSELIADVGKDWINSARSWKPGMAGKAINYGWHGPSFSYAAVTPEGQRVIQPAGAAHGLSHVDYSQVVRLVQRDVEVCGGHLGGCQMLDIDTVVSDPEMAGLISHEGPLPAMAHPSSVDIQACTGPSCQPPASIPPDLDPGESPLLAGEMSLPKRIVLLTASFAAGYLAVRVLL